jgi:hypothetical protein
MGSHHRPSINPVGSQKARTKIGLNDCAQDGAQSGFGNDAGDPF